MKTNHIFKTAETNLPTEFGTFKLRVYEKDGQEVASAIISGNVRDQEHVPLRVHSACFTGESLSSLKCDCKPQLELAMSYIQQHGGVVVYLPQEGRGIGLFNKVRAYALQEQGHDTVEANVMLGFAPDLRTYDEAVEVINDLGIRSIQLMTNNPDKVKFLQEMGVQITGRLPVLAELNQHSAGYLETKRSLMGHMLKPPKANGKVSRTFVHANFAVSIEGKVKSSIGKSLIVSCEDDWKRVHQLRKAYTAVAVGANTWNKDNPRLTARQEYLGHQPVRQPDRVIFAGSTPCNLSEDPSRRTFVVGAQEALVPSDHMIPVFAPDHQLKGPLEELRKHEITSMLVEGGPTLIHSFLRESVIDLLTIYVPTGDHELALSAALEVCAVQIENVRSESLGKGTLLTLEKPIIAENLFA